MKQTVISDSVSVDRSRVFLASHRRGHRGFQTRTAVQETTGILVLGVQFLDCLSDQFEKAAFQPVWGR